jgi:hypothetical protein
MSLLKKLGRPGIQAGERYGAERLHRPHRATSCIICMASVAWRVRRMFRASELGKRPGVLSWMARGWGERLAAPEAATLSGVQGGPISDGGCEENT